MKKKSIFILLIFVLLALTLSACTGGRRVVASGWAGITADEDTAYMAYNNFVYAINLENGVERWRFPNAADPTVIFYAPPALSDDGQLIIGGYNHILYSLDKTNGNLNWTYEDTQGRYIGGPLVTEAGIFAVSTDSRVYALQANGQPLWQPFATEKEIWARPTTDAQCECIFVASMDHRVYALDARQGKLLWETDDLGGAIVNGPTVSEDGVLYVGTFGREVIALDAADGSELWRTSTQDWVWGAPTVYENRLYVGDLSGTLYAINRESGALVWKLQPGGSIVDSPLITEDGIYITAEEGLLVAVSFDGSIRWQQNIEGNTYTAPFAAGDIILVATTQPEALLIALDANGLQKWTFADIGEN